MHTHTHTVDVDGTTKVELFNLQFLNRTEMAVLADLVNSRPIHKDMEDLALRLRTDIDNQLRSQPA